MLFPIPEPVDTPLGPTRPFDLRLALELEAIEVRYRDARQAREARDVGKAITDALSVAGLPAGGDLWKCLESFIILRLHLSEVFSDLPPALSYSEKKKDRQPWDYPNRGHVMWVHILARAYGWTEETILNLHPCAAARYLQEIELDDVFTREWEYSLSEVAWAYDAATKTRQLRRMPRPGWMMFNPKHAAEPPKTRKVPKGLMPMGNIVDLEALSKDRLATD